MFNVEILDKAVTSLSDEGKEEIKKMVDMFQDMKAEVAKLEEIANAYEIVCNNQKKEIEELKAELAKTAKEL